MHTFIPSVKICLFLFLLLYLVPPTTNVYSQERDFELGVKLPPNTWKAARLKNLVKNAVVSIKINGTVPIDVLILNQTDHRNYPDTSQPLFKGRSFGKLSFSVTIPDSDLYFLVLDNKDLTQTADLQLHIQAVADTPVHDDASQLQRSLDQLSKDLSRLFIFTPFPINLQRCGKEGAFGGKGGVILCIEFIEKIQNSLHDQKKSTDVLLFTIFHKIGHVLLYQWNYPFFDNEELADEFATALLMMLRQKERLRATTEFFISNPSAQELMTKAFQNDRHPLSIQRARNILNWMKDPVRIGKWQLFLIPHMQTETLQTLQKGAHSERFKQALDNELEQRH